MEKLYFAQDIRRLFGFTAGRIRYWDKIGFLTPTVKIGVRKYYTSQDIIGYRTVRGLLDAGLSFAKVRRSVIDVKKVYPREMKSLHQLLIHGYKRESVFDHGAIRFNPRGRSLIGFSQRDFERGMKSSNRQIEADLKSEPEESGTAGGTPPGIRGSIEPKNP